MATTEPAHNPRFRTIDLGAEAKKLYGPKWNAPELEYEFSNGRKFYRQTNEAGPYTTATS